MHSDQKLILELTSYFILEVKNRKTASARRQTTANRTNTCTFLSYFKARQTMYVNIWNFPQNMLSLQWRNLPSKIAKYCCICRINNKIHKIPGASKIQWADRKRFGELTCFSPGKCKFQYISLLNTSQTCRTLLAFFRKKWTEFNKILTTRV